MVNFSALWNTVWMLPDSTWDNTLGPILHTLDTTEYPALRLVQLCALGTLPVIASSCLEPPCA